MDRFTKIVLEQLKRGEYETARPSTKMLQSADLENGNVKTFAFRVRTKRNQEYSKFKIPSDLPRTNRGRTYSIEGYFFVIGKEEKLKKGIQQWPIYVYRLEKSPLNNLDPKILNNYKLGNANAAPVFSIEKYNELLNIDPEYEKAKQTQVIFRAIQTDKNPELKAKLTIDDTDTVIMELLIKARQFLSVYKFYKTDPNLSDFQAVKQKKIQGIKRSKDERKKYLQENPKYIEMIETIHGKTMADQLRKQIKENYFKNIGLDKSLKDIIKEIIN
tara:strand:+ start:411 stop:1229 length:819 start_codon:yes stop_codon:yes gene_type:complete